MASIITRAAAGTGATVKGAPLTLAELDANLIALNTDIFVDALPTVEPSLMLDFVNTNELDSRITFTRASTGTYVGPDGLIKTAAVNVPRFDYDPVTMACRGLLAEEGRTNWFIQSAAVNGSWSTWGTPATMQAAAAIAPDGTLSAIQVTSDTSNGVPTPGAGTFTFSFFVKAGTSATVRMWWAGLGVNPMWTFTFGTKVLTVNNHWINPQVQEFPNGWFRISATTNNANLQNYYWGLSAAATGETFFVWGAQIEVGSFVTSYIPTGAAQATRAADYGVINNVHQSTWYSMDRGSMVIEFRNDYMAQSQAGAAFAFAGSWRNNTIFLNPRRDGPFYANGALLYVYESLGVSPGVSVSGAANLNNSASAVYKYAGAWDAESLAIAATNYQVASTSKTARAPTPTFLAFPTDTYSYNPFSGHIRRFAYYPRRVTNAQLQALID